ncbi:hypothetical protein [Nakamurella lactea]|uniref:hypothetical protein n=1 Tax=Nakamurella lactea TaxID=459515 RepID=UPI0003F6F61A|nr:hypothetical protein [Nakamurella lactea]
MSAPWFGGGRNRQATDLAPARSALDGAAQALIDLDTRQGYVDDAIKSAQALTGSTEIARAWTPIAERAFKASAEYLDATAKYPLTDTYGEPNANLDVESARRAFVSAHRAMADAASAVDGFYSRYRDQIEASKRTLAAIPKLVGDARAAAAAATDRAGQVAQQQPGLLDLRSVVAAMDGLSAAMSALDAGGSAADLQQAATAVHAAAGAFTEAINDAPHLAQKAAGSLPSLKTRLDSLATRMQRLPQAQSAMWREFSQASSADLNEHGRRADAALSAARADFDKATTAVRDGRSEDALELVASSRQHAGQADALIDDVTGRLEQLREVKRDPRGAEHPVRFAIRDAQRLVVDRGLAGEWGSVLDAQSARVDRAMQGMDRPHPDYWSMITELRSVREFVADIVDRVRQQARTDRG